MLKFSANLGFLWSDLPLLERMQRAAAAGFKACALHWPYATSPQDVAASCAHHGMVLLSVNTVRGDPERGENGLGALPGREHDFQAAVDQSIAYARAAGASMIHVMAGIVKTEQKAQACDVFSANLALAARKARVHRITLLLEPMNQWDVPAYFYAHVDAAVALIERIGADNIKVLYDVYHAGMEQRPIIEELRRYGEHIGHMQIASVPGRHEPGSGHLDYGAIFRHLDAMHYDGWIGCEYHPRDTVEAGLSWLHDFGLSL